MSSAASNRTTISGGVDPHSIGVRINGSSLSAPNALYVNDGKFGGADSIVGGAIAIETLMEIVRAKEILVSSQGVREGIALRLLKNGSSTEYAMFVSALDLV